MGSKAEYEARKTERKKLQGVIPGKPPRAVTMLDLFGRFVTASQIRAHSAVRVSLRYAQRRREGDE